MGSRPNLLLFLLLFALLLILSGATRRSSFVDYDTVDCDVASLSPSYVDALFERYADAAGCVSNETSSAGQHVHVVYVTSSEVDDGHVVTLNISPADASVEYNGRLVFVLHSRFALRWQIQTEGVNDKTKVLFLLTQGSRLAKNSALRIRVKKYNMPEDRSGLMQWVRTNQGAVTSYLEVPRANKIIKRIGTETSAPEQCIVADNFYAPTTAALYLSHQPIDGCVARWNEGFNNQDTHVIEVHSVYSALSSGETAPSSPQQVSIMVTAKPSRVPRKDLILVLKAHVPVEWVISTSNVRGELKIITDRTVDAQNINMHETQVTHEDLSTLSGVPLVIWAANHGYGPAVSYTSIQTVNRIVLTVDGGDDLPKHRPTSRPPVSPDDAMVHGSAAHILHRAKDVTCGLSSIGVSISKASLRRDNFESVERQQLSLADPGCAARENATHFILQTGLEGCGMRVHQSGASHFYQNAIVLHASEMQNDGSFIEYSDGSGSGVGMDDTYMDDEDMTSTGQAVRVSFQCEYINTRYNAWEHSLDDIDIRMNVFRDKDFQLPYMTFPEDPIRITESDPLFVQVSVMYSDPDLQAIIRDCWVVPAISNHREDDSYRHALITKGCPGKIDWLGSDRFKMIAGQQQFKFDFKKYWEGVFMTHLQCNIALCSHTKTTARAYGIPMCVSMEKYCLTENMVSKNQEPWYRTLVRGPFLREPVRNYEIGVSTDSPFVRSPPGCMKVEGLDSGTVVGIAFAAFIIGVLLTAALWYIHTHTGVRRSALSTYIEGPMLKRNQRSAETSGESTPSSTAPITIHQVHQ